MSTQRSSEPTPSSTPVSPAEVTESTETNVDSAFSSQEAIKLPVSVQRWVNFVFIPIQTDYRDKLRKPWFAFIVILLLFFIALSIPPVQTFLWNSILTNFQASARVNREVWKLYLDSASYILEIIIVLSLGGSVLGTVYTETVKGKISQAEETITNRYLKEEVEELHGVSMQITAQIDYVINDIIKAFKADRLGQLSLLQKFRLYLVYSFRLYNQVFKEIPSRYRNFAIATALTAFPGGLPALLAFIGFILRMVTKLASLYLNSLTSIS